MSDLDLRRARPEDFRAVADLTLSAYVGGGFVAADSPYVAELTDTARRDAEAEVLVADLDGRIVGAVTWCPLGSPWREVADDDEGEFRMLAVADDVRGIGIGETLVCACLDRARDEGLSGVSICTMDSMETAHRLYGRLGFEPVPGKNWSPSPGVRLLAMNLRF